MGGFKTLCLLPSSHGLCNRCPDGPIYPTSSSCRGTEALGDVADLWPTSTTYKWDSCGKKKSYDIFCTVLMLLGLAPQRMDGVDVALQHQTSCCCKMSISVIPLHRIHQEVEATISPPEFWLLRVFSRAGMGSPEKNLLCSPGGDTWGLSRVPGLVLPIGWKEPVFFLVSIAR